MALLFAGFAMGMVGMYYMRIDHDISQQAYWMCMDYSEEVARAQGAYCYKTACPDKEEEIILDFSNATLGKVPRYVNLTKLIE